MAGLFHYGGVVASQSLCRRSLCFESLVVYLDACQFQYQSVFCCMSVCLLVLRVMDCIYFGCGLQIV